MHESHLLNEILEIVRQSLKERNVKEVRRIKINVGVVKMLTPEGLKETFKVLPKEEIFNSTELEVKVIPGDKLIVEEVEILEN